MTDTAKVAPTPWYVKPPGAFEPARVYAADKRLVASFDAVIRDLEEAQALAADAVTAVNEYDALKAVERLARSMEARGRHFTDCDSESFPSLLKATPCTCEIEDMVQALAALDAMRKEVAR